MNALRNLKIRFKLYIMCAVALFGMLSISAVGLTFTIVMNQTTSEIVNDWMHELSLAKDMEDFAADIRLQEQSYIIVQSEAEKQECVDIIALERQNMKNALYYFDGANHTSEKEKELVYAIGTLWEKYVETHQRVIELDKSGDNTGAWRLLTGESHTIFEKLDEKIDALVDYMTYGAARASAQAETEMIIAVSVISGLLALEIIAGIIVAYIIIRSIRVPIADLTHAATEMVNGHLDVHIEYYGHDEIGILAKCVQELSRKLKAIIEDENDFLANMASGNFTVDSICEHEYVGNFEPVLKSFHGILDRLNYAMGQISCSSDQVASNSNQVAGAAQALASGASDQANSIEELSTSINAISTQVQSNAEYAQQASSKVNLVGQEMIDSNEKMKEMIKAMHDIQETSSEIGKIIKTIEDIAFQTNILALNAAVEAARAGSAGKGFAVVADEVRNLASKSAEASKNTAALIENSVHAVANGTRIADETARSLTQAVDGAEDVMLTVNKISEASAHQAESITEIMHGIDQISYVVSTNSATAQESAAASKELSSQAEVLKKLVSEFQLRDEATAHCRSVEPVHESFDDYDFDATIPDLNNIDFDTYMASDKY